ncbi:hypothetical protein O6H91_09G010700 [Diphasiastrum complanatum]|uniref:Uncharacterized protein n=2 Tax=Diphasiastrum complanatum TaxID=34168 RepID=A0ACC2CL73_DIPCM|nr:hypothetical protein O6H91_09G009900 [Diphasiastrum complanatum]KAJ7542765.1 hypothetical protein O6H91_09G010700 [Diphasiastrum complanatum]
MGDQYGGRAGSPDSSGPSENDSGGQYGGGRESSSLREQDRLLPIANVGRIMKKALPANAKISKDAKETVQECVSEFISFITGEASDKCQREKRKTINGDDLLWAMSTLGFEDYVEPLKVYLQRYRELEGEKVSMAKQGDQSAAAGVKEGAIPGGSNGSHNGGVHRSAVPVMHNSPYIQPQIYGQHPMMASYGLPMHSGGGSSGGQAP